MVNFNSKSKNPKNFFSTMFSSYDNGRIEIFVFKDQEKIDQKFFEINQKNKMMKYINNMKKRGHVSFGVAPREQVNGEFSGSKENVSSVSALWADLDFDDFDDVSEAEDSIEQFPLEPSIIISSGNGYHCYWLLEEPYVFSSNEEVENLLKRIEKDIDGDSVNDVSRKMRVPGSFNLKHPEYYDEDSDHYHEDSDNPNHWDECKIIELDSDKTYSLDDFDEVLPELEKSKSQEVSKRETIKVETIEFNEEESSVNMDLLQNELPDWLLDRAEELPEECRNDRSRNDFKVALEIQRNGFSEEECVDAFHCFKKHGWDAGDKLEDKELDGYGDEYISRTVHNASKELMEDNRGKTDTSDTTDTGSFSPELPDEVYERLPDLIHTPFTKIEGGMKRDMVLTYFLPILSALCENATTPYFGDEKYLNLYTAIVGKPGSGKGICENAEIIGEGVEKKRRERTKAQQTGSDDDEEEDPPNLMFFIPGDNTGPGLKENLKDNPQGVIAETEIETLSTALENEWGSFEHILKKNFHNEDVEVNRKTDGTLKIEDPRFSVSLTGTSSDLSPIINSCDDGLFQRFLFYVNQKEPEFENPYAQHNREFVSELEDLKQKFYSLNQALGGNVNAKFQDHHEEDGVSVKLQDYHEELVRRLGNKITEWLKDTNLPDVIVNQNFRIVFCCSDPVNFNTC